MSPLKKVIIIAAIAVLAASVARAVILFRTGDPSANTSEPDGALANSGWQFEGTFGDYLGTAIAAHFFITAQHIGSAPTFVFHGTSYTPIRSWDDPFSDLRIWEVAATFPVYAPIYSGGEEVGQRIVVTGRGTRRGPERVVNGQLRGWEWGAADGVQRWGENLVTSIATVPSRDFLYALFDAVGLSEEAHLSAGDSGGGVFLNDGGIWKLAGINYEVDSFVSAPDRSGPNNAALFDERGSYTANGSFVTGRTAVPSGFYASRVSSSYRWITSIIAPRLANISSRVAVGSADAVGIAGFVVQGALGQSKRLIVRGLGPSLAGGVNLIADHIVDPVLELHDASGAMIAFNDAWRTSQNAEIVATGVAPPEANEAAIIATLSPR